MTDWEKLLRDYVPDETGMGPSLLGKYFDEQKRMKEEQIRNRKPLSRSSSDLFEGIHKYLKCECGDKNNLSCSACDKTIHFLFELENDGLIK